MKRYILEIAYNDETEEIEYLTEEIVEDDNTFYYGDIDLAEYFDEETMELIKEGYIIGDS
tara:strand:- start:1715 stop:1894 length:180 start_codon:yes stop_codon:yes gene_type:complete